MYFCFLCLYRILLSTPFAVVSYFLIWVVPPVEKGKVAWYLIFYCLFQSLQTVSERRTHLCIIFIYVCAQWWECQPSMSQECCACVFKELMLLFCSVFMCLTPLWPCLSAPSRRREILPQRIVSTRVLSCLLIFMYEPFVRNELIEMAHY